MAAVTNRAEIDSSGTTMASREGAAIRLDNKQSTILPGRSFRQLATETRHGRVSTRGGR